MQHQRAANPGADVRGSRAHDHHAFGSAAAAEQSGAIEFTQGFTHGGAINAELARELQFRRQMIARLQPPGDNVSTNALATLR